MPPVPRPSQYTRTLLRPFDRFRVVPGSDLERQLTRFANRRSEGFSAIRKFRQKYRAGVVRCDGREGITGVATFTTPNGRPEVESMWRRGTAIRYGKGAAKALLWIPRRGPHLPEISSDMAAVKIPTPLELTEELAGSSIAYLSQLRQGCYGLLGYLQLRGQWWLSVPADRPPQAWIPRRDQAEGVSEEEYQRVDPILASGASVDPKAAQQSGPPGNAPAGADPEPDTAAGGEDDDGDEEAPADEVPDRGDVDEGVDGYDVGGVSPGARGTMRQSRLLPKPPITLARGISALSNRPQSRVGRFSKRPMMVCGHQSQPRDRD